MICRRSLMAVTAIALSLSLPGVALAQGLPEAPVKSLPFLSPIFGDNMVLQRGKPNIVWGNFNRVVARLFQRASQ